MGRKKVKEIQLTQRKVTIVDDDDFYRVRGYRWCVDSKGYAVSYVDKKNVRLHRFILGVKDPKILIDHINGDGLDNRKANLRVATASQNHANAGKRKHNTSGFKGVHFTKRRAHLSAPWAAYLGALKKTRFLGYFETAILAAQAYDIAANSYYGEFARLNFPKV